MAHNYFIGSSTALAGTTALFNDTIDYLSGSGIDYTATLAVGDKVIVAGQTLTISRVVNSAIAEVTENVTPVSGMLLYRMRNLTALNVSHPKGYFRPFVEQRRLGNGQLRNLGRPVATWTWGLVARAQRDVLRTYCTGPSASVYIRTSTNESGDTFATYSAIVDWPDESDRQSGRRLNFVLTFGSLVPILP